LKCGIGKGINMNLPNRTDVSLMLDSGAYSAWMKKVQIPIEEYGAFILEHGNDFDLIVNLDVIPGEPNQKGIDPKEMLASIEKGWENYNTLISMGVPKSKLIHVFHQGEPFEYLIKMMEEMEYIGISPANDRTTKEKKNWLDECMKYLLDEQGKPKVKFHGFGLTSLRLIWRYPWFSIDSTTWVFIGAMGEIIYPKSKQGKMIYNESAHLIHITEKDNGLELKHNHFLKLSEMEQLKISRYYKDRGFTMEALSVNGIDRDRANMRFFLDFEKTLNGTKVYFAGNFPMLHKMEREYKTMDMALTVTDTYKRLGSYFYKSYLLKLLDLKKRKRKRI
jgi:hypothetical protein